jgi:GTP cyclohydrolase IV
VTELPLPDLQAQRPRQAYRLSRVGVKGVRKPVTVARPGRENVVLTTDFQIYVDLPAEQKGVHMSRNLEAVAELIDSRTAEPVPSLEALCARLAAVLLERHDYARDAEVHAEADYFLPRQAPGGVPSMERYRIIAESRAVRGDDGKPTVRKGIGVEVEGMTACPCAMETARHLLRDKGIHHEEPGPTITHNQRNVAALLVEVPEDVELEADSLIDLVEASLSAPTYEILKRRMEGELVVRAHEKPMFVEDVVREILARVLEAYPELGDETHVVARSEAAESIHKHNAYAERVTTLGQLRK